MNLKDKILKDVVSYYRQTKEQNAVFIPYKTPINYAGRVFNESELINLVDSSLEFWLTYGRYSEKFEKQLAAFLGVKYCSLVNSGSSANLLAFMALSADVLGKRRIQRGDEVITTSCCFPTTVSPIVQYGAVPVFVDIDLATYNIDVGYLKRALSRKTKAIMLAHVLGNPFNVDVLKRFCNEHGLWLIEDNCDALGSEYNGKLTGTFGDIATSSFYPAHHITTGEGGAVYTNNSQLAKIIVSLRDWGRDCFCPSGKDNTCKRRFSHRLGDLPYGYDHKYIYSYFGYNLRATDMQAAIGCAQLKKLPQFIKRRSRNFNILYKGLKETEKYFFLPKADQKSKPCWFGFILTVKENKKFSRNQIVRFLEGRKIQTRFLFSGNIVRHPCFDAMRRNRRGFRIAGTLKNTDYVMNNTFWFGLYPGMNTSKLNTIVDSIKKFLGQHFIFP